MRDLIDRQAALQALSHMMDTDGFRDGWAVSRSNVKNMLESLPSVQFEPCEDAISRQSVFDLPRDRFRDLSGKVVDETVSIKDIAKLPLVRPEPLTDKERRIFLAAMRREEKVCKGVDGDHPGLNEDSLVHVCREITRKVKKALWT